MRFMQQALTFLAMWSRLVGLVWPITLVSFRARQYLISNLITVNWRFDMQYVTVCQNFTDFSDWAAAVQPLTTARLTRFTFPCHIVRLSPISFYLLVLTSGQTVMLTASRPPLVRFAVAMAVIVNWTSTLFIFILTCESLIMRRGWMLSVSTSKRWTLILIL